MKLLELVQKYKGTARFDVNAIVNDNVEDVVVFLNGEIDAIKDNITNADIVRFRVTEIDEGVPVIKVDVRETELESDTPIESETGKTEQNDHQE